MQQREAFLFMKFAKIAILVSVFFLTSCSVATDSTTTTTTTPASTVRNYNGTASVGDFLTIAVDSSAHTIAYVNHTNGETGTVPYTVNADGGYTISDPQGNLLAAYEVPGSVMVIQAANAGPNKDTAALITAVNSVPVTLESFAGQHSNMVQFRTRDGGVEVGTVTIDGAGNITARTYDPGAIMWQGSNYFNGGTFPASSVTEDPSGTFFTVLDQDGTHSTVFGTQNGMWAVDQTNQGAAIGLPKASTKDFNPSVAGTYNAIYYEKQNAQMQNNVETGTPLEGKAAISVSSSGLVTITDSQNNVMASGTLVALEDASYIYDGTSNKMPDPCHGIFTFRTVTSSLHQETFVTFQSNAIIFSTYQTALPLTNNGTYTYFYGVGLK